MDQESSSSDSIPQLRAQRPDPFTLLQNDLRNTENRLRTYTKWPLSTPSPEQLARAGFYYFDTGDQVKCAFCGGIIGQWEVDDEPIHEHQKFFPNCPIVRQQLEEQQIQQQEEIGIQSVRTPKSPEYSTIESRTRSFSTWESNVQDPTVLAQAGFFYLGTSDEVKCFYCDGGLRNWLVGDDPWFEHTRWFPKCPYVMLVKGSNFIKSVLQRSESRSHQSGNESIPAPPAITLDEAMSTQPVLDALAMGLNAGRIKSVVQRRIHLIGRPFNDTETLVSAVLDGQIEDEGFENPDNDRRLESQVTQLLLSAVSSVVNNEDNNENVPSTSSSAVPESENANVEGGCGDTSTPMLPSQSSEENGCSRMMSVECKICMSEEVGVVFLPCGHLLSCVMCAPAITSCPLCRQPIRGRVRTFLS